jgi:hypothetical protein
MNNYKLIGFRKSSSKHKKYDGILKNKNSDKIKYIPFGDARYGHFFDNTGLNEYTHLNHMDKTRRANYRKRVEKIKNKEGKYTYKIKYTANWFSYNYLW